MEEDGVSNEKENEEEALNMGEDGVSNAQDDEIFLRLKQQCWKKFRRVAESCYFQAAGKCVEGWEVEAGVTMALVVKSALSSVASLWRPTTDVLTLDEAVGYKIAWPRDPNCSEDISMEGESRRCKIYDWTNDEDEVIAEGLVCSSKSKEMAYLWRPTANMFLIGDALSEKIAWPVLKVEVMPTTATEATPTKCACKKIASPSKPAKKKAVSPCSTSSTKSPKQKCILLHCNNSGRKVVEGRVASTDPNELCHFVPLDPNGSKVCIDMAKIEAFDLFKTAFSIDEGGPNPTTDSEDDEAPEETEFRKKAKRRSNAIVKSGVSENYFDQLLVLLEDLLPEDNFLPKSLAAIKKFLKIFGFSYVHPCKNDCILYRKKYENLESCPRCKVLRCEMNKKSNETEFVETMCQLERFFPPVLFDIMFHLPVHLSKEARLGGPVHFCWMYPFKEFFKDSVPVQEAVNRNEDVEADRMVVEGRLLQKGIEITLSDKDKDIAHRYVIMNMASLDPFLEHLLFHQIVPSANLLFNTGVRNRSHKPKLLTLGILKCNVGVAWSKGKSMAGSGWMVRNDRGEVMLHSRRAFSGINSLQEAKHVGLLWAIESMGSHRLENVCVEVEAPELVGVVERPGVWASF
ncbi:hypothetical protein Rs2_27055 [Raphanus sativus]|nr:hypothetical protein Rs2_27055 [Raphanus sativus]